jgi:hypothetical protein
MQDVSDDEADIDTDSFDADAESAFIEEFLDHDENEANSNGAVLTPTATAGIA